MKPRTGLGRGLDALIDTSNVTTNGSSSISEVELSEIYPNPNQPRRNFSEEALEELAASIRELGVISPITLRKNEDGTYLIIAGERRFRAAHRAGLTSIPAYIRTAKDEQVMEMALIENIQREDLDAIEIALAYQRLIDEYNLTQERMSERVGKKRATIANYLRLLKLPAEIQVGIKDRNIDMGHARALLSLKTPQEQLLLYKRILKEDLSVRRVEQIVSGEDVAEEQKEAAPKPKKIQLKAEQKALSKKLGVRVRISCSEDGKGKIVLPFNTQEQMEALIAYLDK
ncbi:MAG: ParB/RepB/Spo0J family partition protein [Paludibacteraceae bacterium]|nr:ParB/RepB/Spo0J family partition protein [Paludibacteraceae bacterium]